MRAIWGTEAFPIAAGIIAANPTLPFVSIPETGYFFRYGGLCYIILPGWILIDASDVAQSCEDWGIPSPQLTAQAKQASDRARSELFNRMLILIGVLIGLVALNTFGVLRR